MIKKKINKIFQNPDRKEITGKSFVFILFRIAGLLLGYAFALLVTNYYGSGTYGLVTLSFTVFMILSILGKFGMDLNLSRYVALGSMSKKSLAGLLNRAQLLAIGISAIISSWVILYRHYIAHELFGKPSFEPFLLWAALTAPVWALILIHSGLYRGLKKNALFAIFNSFGRFLATLIVLLIAVFIIDFGNDTTPVLAHFAGLVILLLSALFITYSRLGYPLSYSGQGYFRRFISESRPMLVASLVFILLSWVDRLFIGVYLTEEDVAIYDVAAKLALLISFNLDGVNSILAPKVVEHYATKNFLQLQSVVKFTVGISTLISVFTFLFLLVFHQFLLGLFGEDFKAGKWILIILGLGQLINCMCGSVGIILQMTGHQKTYQRILILGLVMNLLLNFILVKPYGITGVAIATSSSLVLWNLLGLYYVRKKVGVISYFNPMSYISKSRNNNGS